MKIKHLFGLAVLAAMTASCSSNDDLANNPGTGASETGVGYVNFSINLPTTSGGSRADNPEFKPGDDSEYAVNDATLLIFQQAGNSEDEYTYVEKADLGNMNPWKPNGNNGVTTEATITAKLSSVNLKGNYFALILLNNNDNKVKLPTTGDTYAAWNAAANVTAANFADHSKGFYMANAPQFMGENKNPQTLVKVEGIYSTQQAASNGKATTIYVERGLAKVSLATATFDEKTPTGTKYEHDKVKIEAWNLDVTNKHSFPVHKTSGLANEKFSTIWSNTSGVAPVTARFVDGGNSAFKRVYWGADPNYDKDYSTVAAQFNLLDADDITGAADAPQYCLENTFDIEHMKQGQTTRVVFKAKYTPNGFTDGQNFYKIGNSTDIWSQETLIEQIKSKAQEVLNESDASKIDVDLEAVGGDIKNEAGTKLLIAANVKHNSANVSDTEIKAINEKLGLKDKTTTDPKVGIATYKGGETYYIARIKHFGDDLTPWDETKETYGTNDNEHNNKFLGRYGVLRNNWYELTVDKISGPGTPDVPEIKPDVPDDENEKYISVSVKILDWAKRSQTVDL